MLIFGIQAEREKGICNLDQREALDQREKGICNLHASHLCKYDTPRNSLETCIGWPGVLNQAMKQAGRVLSSFNHLKCRLPQADSVDPSLSMIPGVVKNPSPISKPTSPLPSPNVLIIHFFYMKGYGSHRGVISNSISSLTI